MPQVLEATLASRVLTMNLIGTFAVLALVLAMVGIYGVMSYAVTQRAHELGVRIALGASPGDVLRMVLGKGLRLAAAGMAVGLVASFAATRLLRSLLFSVTSTDPATFTAVTVLLTTVVVLACYLPARRASRVDPIVTLRYD
jgi:putative ABC transport system permease protein